MRLKGRQIEGFVQKPDPAAAAALVYGPEPGLVSDRVRRLVAAVIDDPSDPFRVADLDQAAIDQDPARLADEAGQLSLIGGRRLIRVRQATDKLARVLGPILEEIDPGHCFIVIEAGDLPARSELRKLVEGSPRAAALPCYVEEEGDIARFAEATLKTAGVTASREAIDRIAGLLVGDRLQARGEIEKLVLYVGGTGRIAVEDVDAAIGDSAQIEVDELVLAVADGDLPRVDRTLARLAGDGVSMIQIQRACLRHFHRLHVTRARMDAGADAASAMKALRPPLFFKVEAPFRRQLDHWPAGDIARACQRLNEVEAASKRTGAPDLLLTARALLWVAGLAARRRGGGRAGIRRGR